MGVRFVYLLVALDIVSQVLARSARSAGGQRDDTVLCPTIEAFFEQVNENTPTSDLRALIASESELQRFNANLETVISTLVGFDIPNDIEFMAKIVEFRDDFLRTLDYRCDFEPEGIVRDFIDVAFLSDEQTILMISLDVVGSTDT